MLETWCQGQCFAVMKDVPTMSLKEKYVLNMGRSVHLLKLADVEDATVKLRKEEYVVDMLYTRKSCKRHGAYQEKLKP